MSEPSCLHRAAPIAVIHTAHGVYLACAANGWTDAVWIRNVHLDQLHAPAGVLGQQPKGCGGLQVLCGLGDIPHASADLQPALKALKVL